jgi:hypothetical protein
MFGESELVHRTDSLRQLHAAVLDPMIDVGSEVNRLVIGGEMREFRRR